MLDAQAMLHVLHRCFAYSYARSDQMEHDGASVDVDAILNEFPGQIVDCVFFGVGHVQKLTAAKAFVNICEQKKAGYVIQRSLPPVQPDSVELKTGCRRCQRLKNQAQPAL